MNDDGVARGGAMPHRTATGAAFGIDDSLLALRWAEIVQPRGYRLTFSHAFVGADEAIQVHRLGQGGVEEAAVIATLFLGVHWIWVVDGAGRTAPYGNLADALLSLVEFSPSERRTLLASRTPPWLWTFRPKRAAAPAWWRFPLAALTRWFPAPRRRHPRNDRAGPSGQH